MRMRLNVDNGTHRVLPTKLFPKSVIYSTNKVVSRIRSFAGCERPIRIERCSFLRNLEIEVWSSGVSCLAREPNVLSFTNNIPLCHEDLPQVSVTRKQGHSFRWFIGVWCVRNFEHDAVPKSP